MMEGRTLKNINWIFRAIVLASGRVSTNQAIPTTCRTTIMGPILLINMSNEAHHSSSHLLYVVDIIK